MCLIFYVTSLSRHVSIKHLYKYNMLQNYWLTGFRKNLLYIIGVRCGDRSGCSRSWSNKVTCSDLQHRMGPISLSLDGFIPFTASKIQKFLTFKNFGYKNFYTSSVVLHDKVLSEARTHFQLEKKEPFWDSKQIILPDFRETKARVKGKVDEIIERENIWTIPNLLCVTRIGLSPLLCYAVACSQFSLAFGLFIFASFTDLIDGMIARTFPSQASRLGSILDPLADKILIASLFLSLTYVGIIPLPLTGLIIYRDLVIIFAASYIRYRSLPPPITLSRYFDASHATVQLSPTLFSKLNTGVQFSLISLSLAAPVFGFVDHHLLNLFGWFTAATTFASGISYIFSKNTYRILSKPKAVTRQ